MPPKKTSYNRKRPTLSFRVNADVNTVIRQTLKNYGLNIQEFFENLTWQIALIFRESIPPNAIKITIDQEKYSYPAVNEKQPPRSTSTTLPHQEPHTCPNCGSTDLEPTVYGFRCKQCYQPIVLPAKPK